MKQFFLICLCMMMSLPSFCKVLKHSENTEWMRCGEEKLNASRSNTSYYFKIVKISSESLESARNQKVNQLGVSLGTRNQLSGKTLTEIETVSGDTPVSKETFKLIFGNKIESDVFYTRFIDEYWEYISYPDGSRGYEYYALFAVSQTANAPIYDEFSTTTSYGVKPVVMSLVPGWGQMYKGSKTRGIVILAAEVAAIGGIIFTENERASYESKMLSQPKFAKQYKSKVDNYETARNCCIGVAAAIYIYNLIDAAVSPGARRVVIKPRHLQIAPSVSKDFTGFSLSYNF
ncbi:MAG: hypothetical protein J6R91_04950 [Bacteroidaceae bacterium]|nr:hypothetical protein [Bacteroidaceae bacterium]